MRRQAQTETTSKTRTKIAVKLENVAATAEEKGAFNTQIKLSRK